MSLRAELINQRAYEVLNMTQETMYEAAQAAGYSLGRLKFLDELLDCAQIVRQD